MKVDVSAKTNSNYKQQFKVWHKYKVNYSVKNKRKSVLSNWLNSVHLLIFDLEFICGIQLMECFPESVPRTTSGPRTAKQNNI